MNSSIRLKAYSSGRLVVCLAIATVVVAVILHFGPEESSGQSNRAESPTVESPASTISSTIAGLLNLPLYPNAQDLNGDPLNDSTGQFMQTQFRVLATPAEVLKFYDEALHSKGWITDDRNLLDLPAAQHSDFTWFDKSKTSPYALTLSVAVRQADTGSLIVSIKRDKWPDIYNVPVYPGANDMKVTDVSLGSNASSLHVITTTYSTDADLATLQSYYNTVMGQIGFHPITPTHLVPESPLDLPNLAYSYTGGWTPENRWAYTVRIKITPDTKNHNRVEVSASGFDIGNRNK